MAPFSRAPLNLTTALFIVVFQCFRDLAGASSHGVRGGRARALIGREVQLPRTLPRPLGWSGSAQSPYQAGLSTDPPTVLAVQQSRPHAPPSLRVCIAIPFILDVRLVDAPASRGHTGGKSHRIYPLSFCDACLNFYREKDSAVPFPRRP